MHRHRALGDGGARRVDGRAVAARPAAGAAAARHRHLPRHADAAGGRPGALDPARQRRAGRRPHARDGRQPRPRGRGARARTSSTTSASSAPSRACSRCPTGRCGSSSRAASACSVDELGRRGALPRRARSPRCPTSSRRAPELDGADAQRPADVLAHRRARSRTCPRSCSSRSPTSTTRRALAHLIAGSLRIKTEEKQELLEERRRRQAAAAAVGDPRARARGRRDRLADPVAGPVRARQVPARVRPAPAAQGDPGGARRARPEPRPRSTSCASSSTQVELPEDVRKAGRPRARAPREAAAGRPPSTASSAPTWSGSPRCRGTSRTEDNLDLEHAREVLDADHYDIEQVKDRILEFLAVRRLKPDARGSILCFVGPPGVGKTSLGPLDRRARWGASSSASRVGGVRDEAEIRGHRRTYIGAMPGRDHPRAARRRAPTTRCS